jgi:hypothetical protein
VTTEGVRAVIGLGIYRPAAPGRVCQRAPWYHRLRHQPAARAGARRGEDDTGEFSRKADGADHPYCRPHRPDRNGDVHDAGAHANRRPTGSLISGSLMRACETVARPLRHATVGLVPEAHDSLADPGRSSESLCLAPDKSPTGWRQFGGPIFAVPQREYLPSAVSEVAWRAGACVNASSAVAIAGAPAVMGSMETALRVTAWRRQGLPSD